MAVYEQTYKRYDGKLTPEWSRFLIIPRYAYRGVFKSKIFTAFFVVCFIPLLVEAILIYLHHNINALAIMKINVREVVPIDAFFFQTFLVLQGFFAFFVALLVGPPLVSRDLRNNALPLYLCRPFSRTEYVMGKMSVLLILLSFITWVPQLLLFGLQSYLEGFSWFRENLWLANGIIIGSLVWILLLSLLSQAISALVKWRVVASGAILGIFLIPSAFAGFLNLIFRTHWGNLFSLFALMQNITAGLFGTFTRVAGHVNYVDINGNEVDVLMYEPPLWMSWAVICGVCLICLVLLSWKVKAYEVVR
jgi:ABC-type transport system involved in multi-copper enzyme maturation permease subunit